MKVKLIFAFDDEKFENKVNNFLAENNGKIEVIEIQWKWILSHYAMIIFKEI